MSHNSMKILKATPETDDQEEIFSYLPPEIIPNILSRIPIKTICSWKRVCKSWLELIESPWFIRSHLSNSGPGLLIHLATKEQFKILEFEDSSPEIESHKLHYKKVLELEMVGIFDLSDGSGIDVVGSANGLLFLLNIGPRPCDHYVCNPITREYIKLPKPEGIHQNGTIGTYGFGVSRLSNQYKVVRIFQDRVHDPDTGSVLEIPKRICQVYSLGTESWRDVVTTPCEMLDYVCWGPSNRLLNGNLHWLARDLTGSGWISCFDLEAEVSTKFRAPTVESKGSLMEVGVLWDRLCLCDNSSADTEVSIYMMSDYADEDKSWNKEYIIRNIPGFVRRSIVIAYALKAFGDGDLLVALEDNYFLCYCNRTKTMVPVFNGAAFDFVHAILHTPSFISLKNFETEKSKLFRFEVK